MVKNKNIIIGSALLALGFLNNSVYGSDSAVEREISLDADASEELEVLLINAERREGLAELAKFIREGGNYTAKSSEGNTVLHMVYDPSVAMSLLFLPGVDINAKNKAGNTALKNWIRLIFEIDSPSKMDVDAIRMFLMCGANPLIADSNGQTPLQALKQWIAEEEALPEGGRSYNSAKRLKRYKEVAQLLRVAEKAEE